VLLNEDKKEEGSLTNGSIIEKTCSSRIKTFVLSPSKHERLGHPPFYRLRVNGVLFFSEEKEGGFSGPMFVQLWTD